MSYAQENYDIEFSDDPPPVEFRDSVIMYLHEEAQRTRAMPERRLSFADADGDSKISFSLPGRSADVFVGGLRKAFPSGIEVVSRL